MRQHCILQVEDEEADIYLLQYVFKQADIQVPVKTVTDGQIAIDYLSGAGSYADRDLYPLPFLILLDVKLPKLSGLDVLHWMRQQSKLKRIVVIVFSSSAQPGDVQRAYEWGAHSFLQKPADMEHTLEIARLLKGWWLEHNRYAGSSAPPQAIPAGGA